MGEHEVYSDCIQGDCRPKNCSQLGFPVSCPSIDPKFCEKGCLCSEGYVRDKYGECIPTDQCRKYLTILIENTQDVFRT